LLLVKPEFCVVAVTVAGALRGQLNAALGASGFENESPTFCRHAGPKAVGAGALDFAGLKCSFHCDYLDH